MRGNLHASLPVGECCGGEKEFWIEINVVVLSESRWGVLKCLQGVGSAWQSLVGLQMPRGGHRSDKSAGHSWLIPVPA